MLPDSGAGERVKRGEWRERRKTDRFVKVELVRSVDRGRERESCCSLMIGLRLSRNCARSVSQSVSLTVDIYTGRGGKSRRPPGIDRSARAQKMDELTRFADCDEDGIPIHDGHFFLGT